MTVSCMSREEFEYLIRALASEKEWSKVVDEILPNGTHRHRHSTREVQERAVRLLVFLDEKGISTNFICSWLLLVHRLTCTTEMHEEELHNASTVHIRMKHLLKCLSDISEDEARISVITLINTLVEENLSDDIECVEQAHIITQILQSEMEGISFEKHVQKEEIWRFWNQIAEIASVDASSSQHSSRVWSDYDARRSKEIDPKTIENIINTGDAISGHIFKAAKFAQDGLAQHVVPAMTSGIEKVGEMVIENTSSHVSTTEESDNGTCSVEEEGQEDMKGLIDITDKSVQTTDYIRKGARSVAFGVRDFSTWGVQNMTEAWKEKELGKQMIPDDDVREVVVATGKVGLATLGAAALLTESVFETTKAVAQTSVKVASEVASHKYGNEAGTLVNNTGVAAGNVLRTVTHVAMLEATVLTKVIAKNTAKIEMEESSNDSSLNNPNDSSRELEKLNP